MTSRVAPVDITTLQERVYQELREALSQGRLTAGESLTIRALATALGTSEMPVREALKRLLAERVLVQAPNRTFQIAPMTPSRLHELTVVRASLEEAFMELTADSVEYRAGQGPGSEPAVTGQPADGARPQVPVEGSYSADGRS